MNLRCGLCMLPLHTRSDCPNKKKYWVDCKEWGTDESGFVAREKYYKTMCRDFIIILNGHPHEIPRGSSCFQNPRTKQLLYNTAPPPETVDMALRCRKCGQSTHKTETGEIDQNCPNESKYWVATQKFGNNLVKQVASRDFIVFYCATPIEIRQGQEFWQDSQTKQVAVGWHGTVSPPCDMDGRCVV